MKVYLVKLESLAKNNQYRVFLKDCKFNGIPVSELKKDSVILYSTAAFKVLDVSLVKNPKHLKLDFLIPTDRPAKQLESLVNPTRETIDNLLTSSYVKEAKPLLHKLILRYEDNSTEIVDTPNYIIDEVIRYGT